MPTEGPWWAPPAMAVQFLTRIPVPWLDRLDGRQAGVALARATAWLPAVGALIGALTAAVFVAAGQVWPALVAVIVALVVEAYVTGAFHEDAVADYCDAFGGGRPADEVRRILKDSRIGSYGALGLILAVALRGSATLAIPAGLAVATIVAAATVARWCAVLVMTLAPPAPTGAGMAKDIGRPPRGTLARATVLALPGVAAIAILRPGAAIVALVAVIAFAVPFARHLVRRIGGSTGDCLGFAAYAAQIIVLMVMAGQR